MKTLKEYELPPDQPECPRALAFYNEKALIEDWKKEHPQDTPQECIAGLMKFSNGKLNPRSLIKLSIYKGDTI